ncbi:MAG: hypothetical protein ACLFP4_14990 [Spirochaetales bacterium]
MKSILSILMLLASASLFAEVRGSAFIPQPTEIALTPSENLHQIQVRDDLAQQYDHAYKDRDGKYEIRVISFATDPEHQNIVTEADFFRFTTLVTYNIAGDPSKITRQVRFGSSGLGERWKAESGYAVFVLDEERESSFLSGNQYAIINYFFNSNYGIICNVVMFDDLSVMDDPEYNDDFSHISAFVSLSVENAN